MSDSVERLSARKRTEFGPGHNEAEELAVRRALVSDMLACAPKGQAALDDETLAILRRRTSELIETQSRAHTAYQEFMAIQRRELQVPHEAIFGEHEGKTILVTGGTGCIGTTLLGELVGMAPERVVSVSRGVSEPWGVVEGVDYVQADVCDAAAIEAIMQDVQPDIVYHLAAQRDPSLAEVEVARTVGTNIFGVQNVVAAAERAGVSRFIHASTGKTLRPFSPDVYAATKKAGEWLLANRAVTSAMAVAGVRFTHVVDNSIVLDRVQHWADGRHGGVVRLHSAENLFYGQSAIEAAQLLTVAAVDARPGGLHLFAIRNLGLPINLLDLALGVLRYHGSDSPIYFCGYEQGYEELPYPALYHPRTAGDVSPLISAFEADHTTEAPSCEPVDVLRLDIPDEIADSAAFAALSKQTASGPDGARVLLDELCWRQMVSRLKVLNSDTLAYILKLGSGRPELLNEEHRLTNKLVEEELATRI